MSNIVRPSAIRDSPLLGQQWLWAALSFVGWIAATAVTLPIASIAALTFPDATIRVDLGVWIVLTGAVSLALVLVAGRATFGRFPRVGMTAIVVGVIGIAVAAAEELLLHEWAEARFGYYDSEMVWWTASLSGLVIATTVATFGILIAPLGARFAPMLCQTLGVIAVALVVGSNVEGLADGMRPESWPLAIAIGLCLVYVLAAVAACWIDRRT